MSGLPVIEVRKRPGREYREEDGVIVLHDGANILGDEWSDSFRNCYYESSDGYAAMALLGALERAGIIRLKMKDSLRHVYSRSLEWK